MQRPSLRPEELHLMTLANQRTRLYTKPSPTHPDGLSLFGGLPSPPLRKHLSKTLPTLRPGLTPWMNDWASDLNDLLPDEGFDFWGDDLPDDGLSLGAPVERVNCWEKPWIQARREKKRQEIAKKEEQALKRKYKKRSVPLTKAGRKRAWKKRVEGKMERENGQFIKKEEVIIIGGE
ncbi:hypothetical protein IFR05_010049 [Cadophora sp. M221]|nr:hypothetical protein IFR05_010049 [Cadophora sp. M221]